MYRKHYKPSNVQRSYSQLDSIPAAKEAYRMNVEANYMDHDGCTKLHLAVSHDNVQLIDNAIKAGCDVNASDKYSRHPVHIAADKNCFTAIKRLLREGVEVNVFSDEGLSPLMMAARKGHHSVMRQLLHGGARVNSCNSRQETALHYAAAAGYVDAVDTLLAAKALVDAVDVRGATPLMLAAKGGSLKVTEALLAANAKINARDADGSCAVHYAIQNYQNDTLKLLMEKKADFEVENKQNQTPFVLSIFCNNCDALLILLQHNCERTIDGLNGTPLTLAALKGHNKCVRILLEEGEDADEYGYFGMTPVMSACFEGHVDVLETLLDMGADPDYPGRMGVRAIHKCLIRLTPENVEQRQEVLIRLIRAGADVNMRLTHAGIFTTCTNGRNCPLSFALQSGYTSLVHILLHAGVTLEGHEICSWMRSEYVQNFFDVTQLVVPIKEYFTVVKSLTHICRAVTRKSLCSNPDRKIAHLPIAEPMKRYLNFEEFDSVPVERAGTVQEIPLGLPDYFSISPCGIQTLEGTFIHQSIQESDVVNQ